MHPDPKFFRRANTSRAIVRPLSALFVASTIAMAGLIVATPKPAYSQPAVSLVIVDVAAVGKGYRTSKLTGRAVVNSQNERVGTIDDFIIGRDRVLFSILQVGGFLGLGSRLVAVPYLSLMIDDTGTKITLPGATKDELKKLAEFKYL